MSTVSKLASAQGTRSDVPNQELARELAASDNTKAIQELVQNLNNKDKSIQSDCIKVLYETGYLKPELIAGYVQDFVALLNRKNNRLVWGGMIALSTIAGLRAKEIYDLKGRVIQSIEKGSVITVDAGIRTLAGVAQADVAYNTDLFPTLLTYLQTCRPKSVAQYAESILPAVTELNKAAYVTTLEKRKPDLNPAQTRRLAKILKSL